MLVVIDQYCRGFDDSAGALLAECLTLQLKSRTGLLATSTSSTPADEPFLPIRTAFPTLVTSPNETVRLICWQYRCGAWALPGAVFSRVVSMLSLWHSACS